MSLSKCKMFVFKQLITYLKCTVPFAQQARLLDNIELEKLAGDKHSNLLGLFISYEENEVL
jgi:hypothetical protein